MSGDEDYNDPRPSSHVYGDEERAVFKQLYGDANLQELWQEVGKFLAPHAPNVLIHTYPHVEHDGVWEDQIEFLKKHIHGGPLKPITLTDTSNRPALLPIKIIHLYFGQQVPIQSNREYLNDTDLILECNKMAPYWVSYENACKLDVLSQGKVVLSKLRCPGQFEEKDKSFLQVRLTSEEAAKLKACKNCMFSVRSYYPKIVEIPADLTFSIP